MRSGWHWLPGDVDGPLLDLLLPRTDAGVLVQTLLAGVIFATLLAVVWRWREARVFVAGAGVLALALMGLRAVH